MKDMNEFNLKDCQECIMNLEHLTMFADDYLNNRWYIVYMLKYCIHYLKINIIYTFVQYVIIGVPSNYDYAICTFIINVQLITWKVFYVYERMVEYFRINWL